jgi:D-glycero-D-manno-heptose 1,7-bisphosphate phosphatase
MARRAVFLDRDGVLNRSLVRNGKPIAPRRLAEFRLLPGASAAVARVKAAGFLAIVVTNQPDVGHGLIPAQELADMHARLSEKVPVDAILVCPHRQDAGCSCRKPKPGLIRRAMRRWRADPARSYMVGDRWSDIVAGRAAGLYTVFVDRGYSEVLTERPDVTVRSLREAVSHILTREATRR